MAKKTTKDKRTSKTAKTTKKVKKAAFKPAGRKPAKKIRRVGKVSRNSADVVANVLDMPELARELTEELPKAVVTDVKRFGAQTVVDHSTIEDSDSYRYFENSDSESIEDLINYIRTRDALQTVESIENLAADATKAYWRSKRRMVLVNKVLKHAYHELENSDTINVPDLSKDQVGTMLAELLDDELFADKKLKS